MLKFVPVIVIDWPPILIEKKTVLRMSIVKLLKYFIPFTSRLDDNETLETIYLIIFDYYLEIYYYYFQ